MHFVLVTSRPLESAVGGYGHIILEVKWGPLGTVVFLAQAIPLLVDSRLSLGTNTGTNTVLTKNSSIEKNHCSAQTTTTTQPLSAAGLPFSLKVPGYGVVVILTLTVRRRCRRHGGASLWRCVVTPTPSPDRLLP